jgi:hypothetical protein
MEGTFTWMGRELPYLDHPYNTTALNERAVEVPIALSWSARREGEGLEVGNVLSHYAEVSHRVIDLYEEAPGVDNVDVLAAEGRYDWIVAVSTLEHVGWEKQGAGNTRWEDEDTPWGPIAAHGRLLGMLKPGGRMLVTVPFGQHPYLDGAVLSGGLGPTTYEATLTYEGDRWATHEGSRIWRPAREMRWAGAVWVATWQAAT